MAIALAIGITSAPAVNASPGTAEEQMTVAAAPYVTYTLREAWLRQCASFSCGYHVLPAGMSIRVFCYTDSAGLMWNVAVTNNSSYLAGHLDASAIAVPHTEQSCSNAGRQLFPSSFDLWLHSCPAMACGYGVSPGGQNHDIAGLSPGPFREGYEWYLILDHDNVNTNLVGWVHTEDIDS